MPPKKGSLSGVPFAFGPDSFKTIVNASLSNLCNLQNENLFPPERVLFSNRKSLYAQILPSLLLASRIILDEPQSFNVFIARRDHQGTVEEEDVIKLGPDELINIIRCHIPDLDFDLDIAQKGEECGMTHLLPNEPRDLVTIDYTLIKPVIDKETGTKRKTVALAYIAILLCHQLAHVLEFRSIRNAQFKDDGEAFETPPGITGTEAGTSWEALVFGGGISPVSIESDLSYITGLSIQSSRWRYLHMAMDFEWISRLFDENFWVEKVTPKLFVPYNPRGLALASSIVFDEDEAESPEPRTITQRRRGGDVRVELIKPLNKPAKLPNMAKMVQVSRRSCGGKRLHLPPLGPLNKTSGSRSDLGHALSAKINPGNSITASESPLPSSAHVQQALEANGQPGSTINASPNFSNSETTLVVVRAELDHPHSA